MTKPHSCLPGLPLGVAQLVHKALMGLCAGPAARLVVGSGTRVTGGVGGVSVHPRGMIIPHAACHRVPSCHACLQVSGAVVAAAADSPAASARPSRTGAPPAGGSMDGAKATANAAAAAAATASRLAATATAGRSSGSPTGRAPPRAAPTEVALGGLLQLLGPSAGGMATSLVRQAVLQEAAAAAGSGDGSGAAGHGQGSTDALDVTLWSAVAAHMLHVFMQLRGLQL